MVKLLISYCIIFFLISYGINSGAQLTDTSRQEITYKNLITNPGFENGKAGWSVSGGDTFSLTSGTSAKELGKSYVSWNSAGAGRVFTHSAITVDYAIAGQNGLCEFNIAVPSGTATHLIRAYDGTNVLASATITSSTIATRSSVSFIFGAVSSTIQCQLVSVAADEPTIDILEGYDGRNYRLGQSAQVKFIGSAYFAQTANCTLTRSSATLGALSDSDCPGPTVESNPGPGTIQTTDANAPKVSVNSLPPGRYEACFSGPHNLGSADAGGAMAINDGTTTSGQQGISSDTSNGHFHVCGWFEYSNAADRYFELFASTPGAVAVNIPLNTSGNARVYFTLKQYPLTSQTTYSIDQLPSYWSGYHVTANCAGWTLTSASYVNFAADADCNLTEQYNRNFGTVTSYTSGGSELPGLVFTPKRAGSYKVCANFAWDSGSARQAIAFRLTDGTTAFAEMGQVSPANANDDESMTLCGIINIASVTSTTVRLEGRNSSGGSLNITQSAADFAIRWTVMALDQSFPAAVFTGNVLNSGAGTIRVEAAELNCDAGSSIVRQGNGSNWISSIGNISTGICAVGFTAGTFSATPYCVATNSANAFAEVVVLNETTSGFDLKGFTDSAGAVTSLDVHLICVGAR